MVRPSHFHLDFFLQDKVAVEMKEDEQKEAIDSAKFELTKEQDRIEMLERELAQTKEEMDRKSEELGLLKQQLSSTTDKKESQRAENETEMDKLQKRLNARETQVEKLQNSLNEQIENFEALKEQSLALAREFDSNRAGYDEQILQLEHSLAQEKAMSATMLKAFEEQEVHWDEKRRAPQGGDKGEEGPAKEIAQMEAELKALQCRVHAKESELEEFARTKAKTEEMMRKLEAETQTKLGELEERCEGLKSDLQHKEKYILARDESLTASEERIAGLEAKVATAEDIELELRHHLGQVTQELETLNESGAPKGEKDNVALRMAREQVCV